MFLFIVYIENAQTKTIFFIVYWSILQINAVNKVRNALDVKRFPFDPSFLSAVVFVVAIVVLGLMLGISVVIVELVWLVGTAGAAEVVIVELVWLVGTAGAAEVVNVAFVWLVGTAGEAEVEFVVLLTVGTEVVAVVVVVVVVVVITGHPSSVESGSSNFGEKWIDSTTKVCG